MQAQQLLTLRETAVVAGVKPTFIKREVQRRVVRPRRAKKHVLFPEAAALYFAVVSDFLGRLELPPSLRSELYALLTNAPSPRAPTWERAGDAVWLHGRNAAMKLDTSALKHQVAERLALLARRATRIHSDPAIKNGVPVFKGTRIPVENVRGQLARGASVDELAEHYPGLPREDIQLAQLLNELGRPPGRPKRIKPVRIVRA